MIPIRLTLEGLYSYQHAQTIDFTSLIEAGLFGIFGKVGSGKSSILEAISFVLYGETERMNARDNRAYNMMNLKSSRLVIDFEFYNFQDKKYRIYREFKRNSKRYEDVKRTEAVLYEWQSECWVPLNHLDTESVIGLSYDNFKRTIIIPQGQFKEFIELGGAARTKMMQEIFGLDRFDLYDKTRVLQVDTKKRLDRIEGELKAYESVSESELATLRAQWEKLREELGKLTKELTVDRALLQKLQRLKEDVEALEKKEKAWQEMQRELSDKQVLQTKIDLFEKVEKNFKKLLGDIKDNSKILEEKVVSHTLVTQHIDALEKQRDQLQLRLDRAKEAYASLDNAKKIRQEWRWAIEIRRATLSIKGLEMRMQKGKKTIRATEEKQVALQAKRVEEENALQKLKKEVVPPSVLINLGQWYLQHGHLRQQHQNNRKQKEEYQVELNEIDKEIKEVGILDKVNWESELGLKQKELESGLAQWDNKRHQLAVSQELSVHAHLVHEGKPCPLCGSLEHPNVLELSEVDGKVIECQEKVDCFKEQLEALRKTIHTAVVLFDKYERVKKLLEEHIQKEQCLTEELEKHLQLFAWDTFDPQDQNSYVERKLKAEKDHEYIEKKEQEIFQIRQQLDELQPEIDKYKSAVQRFEIEKARWEAEVAAKNKQIQSIPEHVFSCLSESELELKIEEQQAKIKAIEEEFQSSSEAYQNLIPQLAAQQTHLNLLRKEIQERKQILTELKTRWEKGINESDVTDSNTVESILAQNLDIPKLRKEVHDFFIGYEVLKKEREILKEKLEKNVFDEVFYLKQQNKVSVLEEEEKKLMEDTIALRSEIDRLTREYEIKKGLIAQKANLDKRAENLATMINLFKSSGFVNYVSSIYLRNLCQVANIRFHKLTKNQLSLQLNDSNEFEIIDYLNNGKPRSVKTLSGGQSFQVSLSLALALAESVQSLAVSDKNFFFIDEGFGTQDSESVNVVFETLNSLRKENRIVGVISHVEELQERIPAFVQVVKDADRGSLLFSSVN